MELVEQVTKYIDEWQKYGESEVKIAGVDVIDDAACLLLKIAIEQPDRMEEVLTLLQVPNEARAGLSINSFKELVKIDHNDEERTGFILSVLGSELADLHYDDDDDYDEDDEFFVS